VAKPLVRIVGAGETVLREQIHVAYPEFNLSQSDRALSHTSNTLFVAENEEDGILGLLLFTVIDAFAGRYGGILELVLQKLDDSAVRALISAATILAKEKRCKGLAYVGDNPLTQYLFETSGFRAEPTTIFKRDPFALCEIRRRQIGEICFTSTIGKIYGDTARACKDIQGLREVLNSQLTNPLSLAELNDIRNRPNTLCYFAYAGSTIVGMAWVFRTPGLLSDHNVLDGVAVSPDYQGKYIGQEIIRQAADDATIHGYSLILTSNRLREAARHIYTKAGFEEQVYPYYYLQLS